MSAAGIYREQDEKQMKTVRILMAAYNGEKYLRSQLDSILAQRGVEVSLLIRDDGSSDQTKNILRAYAQRFHNISIYDTGENEGASGSFYDLLIHTDVFADYYAFADQDDVWYADKLAQAVRLLEQEQSEQPLLYAGKVICVSENLERQETFSYRIAKEPSFGNALMENICMGCTEVFNKRLLLLVREHLPHKKIMHDWWMYLTAAYFGKAVYDQNAYMLYRQHGENQIGMQNYWRLRWMNRLLHIRQMKHKLSEQAAVFRNAYIGYAPVQREDLYRLELMCGYRAGFRKKIRLVFSLGIYRQNRLDDWICRMLILAGYL